MSTKTRTQLVLLMGWREDPTCHPHQLTHAVELGRHVAECGVHVDVIGAAWPDLGIGLGTAMARCPTCTKAVYLMWSGDPRD